MVDVGSGRGSNDGYQGMGNYTGYLVVIVVGGTGQY